MTTITRARAAAILAAAAIALTACHPDDNLGTEEGKTVTISAIAALPQAGISAGGTATRSAAKTRSAAITRASTTSDVFFNGGYIGIITLQTYGSSSATAPDAKTYNYKFTPVNGDDGNCSSASLTVNTDATPLKAKVGSKLYLGSTDVTAFLLMKVPTAAGGGTATVDVPFRTHVKMDKTEFTVGGGGALSKPLTLAYTTAALRLRLVIADAGVSVSKVSCKELPMANGAPNESTPTRTDGGTESSDITQQTVIFGELTPGTQLKAGDVAATLQLSDGNDPDGGTGTQLAVQWTAAVLKKINSKVPDAGKMMTLTVHVSRTVASIATGGITIGGFTDGNGDGEDITAGYQGDGTNTLDTKIFNANNPLWVVSGGGNGNNDKVVANVRAALESMKNSDSSLPTSAQGVIDLVLTGVTDLPSTSISSVTDTYNRGAFQDCPQLRSVNAPKATTIEENAFKDCPQLRSVNAPKATTIEENAFNGCTALKSVSLPAATMISWDMFDGCAVLTSLDISGVTEANNIKDSYYGNGFTPKTKSAAVRPEVSLGEVLFGKNDGAATRGDVGNATFDTTKCNLVISRTLYNDSSVTQPTNKTFAGKTWASITYPGAPATPNNN